MIRGSSTTRSLFDLQDDPSGSPERSSTGPKGPSPRQPRAGQRRPRSPSAFHVLGCRPTVGRDARFSLHLHLHEGNDEPAAETHWYARDWPGPMPNSPDVHQARRDRAIGRTICRTGSAPSRMQPTHSDALQHDDGMGRRSSEQFDVRHSSNYTDVGPLAQLARAVPALNRQGCGFESHAAYRIPRISQDLRDDALHAGVAKLGIRAGFRSLWAKARGGSNPLTRTNHGSPFSGIRGTPVMILAPRRKVR